MSVTVEDGSGIEEANSPVSVEEADEFWGTAGNFSWDASSDKEAALVRGTAYVDAAYNRRWKGVKTYGRKQGIAFPRKGVVDRDGNDIEEDEVPKEYKTACIVAALQASLGNLDITTDAEVFVTSEQLGPLKTTYERITTSSKGSAGVRFPDVIDQVLDNLITGAGGVHFFARA